MVFSSTMGKVYLWFDPIGTAALLSDLSGMFSLGAKDY